MGQTLGSGADSEAIPMAEKILARQPGDADAGRILEAARGRIRERAGSIVATTAGRPN